jgi:hypothetical protein
MSHEYCKGLKMTEQNRSKRVKHNLNMQRD